MVLLLWFHESIEGVEATITRRGTVLCLNQAWLHKGDVEVDSVVYINKCSFTAYRNNFFFFMRGLWTYPSVLRHGTMLLMWGSGCACGLYEIIVSNGKTPEPIECQ